MLVQVIEGAVEHELRGEELVGGVDLAGRPPLQQHHVVRADVAQLAQDLQSATTPADVP